MNLELIESLTTIFCGLAIFGFTFVATASRNPKIETFVQQMISICCIVAVILLSIIAFNDGSIWSSKKLVQPLIAVNLIITIAARINLRGKQVSQGMNPHQIARLNQEE
jgi:hypothetical protein